MLHGSALVAQAGIALTLIESHKAKTYLWLNAPPVVKVSSQRALEKAQKA